LSTIAFVKLTCLRVALGVAPLVSQPGCLALRTICDALFGWYWTIPLVVLASLVIALLVAIAVSEPWGVAVFGASLAGIVVVFTGCTISCVELAHIAVALLVAKAIVEP
jgi:hypothetical protein